MAARRDGVSHLNATASDGQRRVTSAPATITVEPPPAAPSAGQVVINEALVSFASSTTQARAYFVELHNSTDRALDISGLVISSRAGGSGNNVRAVTLPSAVGTGMSRIGPRSYFLIINGANGAKTFGAMIQSGTATRTASTRASRPSKSTRLQEPLRARTVTLRRAASTLTTRPAQS